MQLEAGKFYRDREGRIHGPIALVDDSEWPWNVANSANSANSDLNGWRTDGSYSFLRSNKSSNDLIEEVPAPGDAGPAPEPEIPLTETAIRLLPDEPEESPTDALQREVIRQTPVVEDTPFFDDEPPAADPVDHPPHYTAGGIECIDAMRAMLNEEEFIGYLRGNSFKYRWRFRHKGGAEDLRKAEWHEKRLLEIVDLK